MSKIKRTQNKLEVENKRQIVDFYLRMVHWFQGIYALKFCLQNQKKKTRKKKEIKKNKAYQINLLKLGKKQWEKEKVPYRGEDHRQSVGLK